MCVKARRPGIIYIMENRKLKDRKLKVGDRVKIINTCLIEDYELGEVGTLTAVPTSDGEVTYTVDMGRSRRPDANETCWYLRKNHIELINEPGQLLFPFMEIL